MARPFRLAAGVQPLEYRVHVAVDPNPSARYSGRVSIRLALDQARRRLELHSADLRLSHARVHAAGITQPGAIMLHPERETAEIRVARPIPAGEVVLELDFAGKLRRDLRGLYAAAANGKHYAFTQLEAADARRFFPSFDEPALKARFQLSVTTDSSNHVLSNASVDFEEKLPKGQKIIHFQATPLLSTYLVALAVGPLVGSEPVYCGATPIRVWHIPGKERLTSFALEAARESLARLERWFDLSYPYGKLDLVAVPDFEAGAMENAGAVFFRETLLLLDPATASLQEQKRAAEVICHELAHMWYGNLVTMAWWDDLWLNEAFATWMAFEIVNEWKPQWKLWHDFEHHRAAAFHLDALESTHPIYTPVRTPSEATQNFDLITYEKGASVVRMIERYLGPKVFRRGVRAYIRRHAEGNTVATDLWRALEAASGQPITKVVRTWIEQPGFPLVTLCRVPGESAIELRQERFLARPSALQPKKGAKSKKQSARHRPATRWPIPWVARLGEGSHATRLERRLFTKTRERISLPGTTPLFVYGNADEGGFFRPLHDEAELTALAGSLAALQPVERMGLLEHQWALVRSGRAKIESFLQLVPAFSEETEPDVLFTLRAPLGFLDAQMAPAAGGEVPEHLRAWIVEGFGVPLERLGFAAQLNESDEKKMRRAALWALLGEIAEWEPLVRQASLLFDAYHTRRTGLDPNLANSVVALAARASTASRYAALLEARANAPTPRERERFQLALGEVRAPRLIDRTLRLLLTETIPTQDVVSLLARLLNNPAAREQTWTFVRRRWSALKRRMPPMLISRLVEALPALQSEAHRRSVAAFFQSHPVPTAARALRQTQERFRLNAEMRRRNAPALERWLGETRAAERAG